MLPFVGVGLAVQEKLEIHDQKGQRMVMRFAKLYPPEKMGKIVEQAKTYWWWRNNPTASFMKAVGVINRNEREEKESADQLTAAREANVGD